MEKGFKMKEISFKSEKARIKGIGILFRLPFAFKGLERNRFVVEDETLNFIEDLVKVSK